MDFAVVLILPFAATVASAMLLAAAALKRPKPKLVWPFIVSTLAVAPAFLRLPNADTLVLWIFSVVLLAIWAALGTIVGAAIAKLAAAAARSFRRR